MVIVVVMVRMMCGWIDGISYGDEVVVMINVLMGILVMVMRKR